MQLQHRARKWRNNLGIPVIEGEEQAGLKRSGTKSRDRNTRAAFPTETLNPDPEAAE